MSSTSRRITFVSLAVGCLAVSACSQDRQTPHGTPLTQQSTPAAVPPSLTGPSLDWDQAFHDVGGATPLHFTAAYLDSVGKLHHLEEWRVGQNHLRRRTDNRIDLHVDATHIQTGGQPVEYRWQVLDLQNRIDHHISSAGMLRLGMLYSYYSVAHVLTRPAARFEIHAVPGLKPLLWKNTSARWFDISTGGRPVTRVCWDAALGIPIRMFRYNGDRWTANFELTASDARVPAASLTSDTKGFQVRDVAEIDPD